jgi:hypothetical protein
VFDTCHNPFLGYSPNSFFKNKKISKNSKKVDVLEKARKIKL